MKSAFLNGKIFGDWGDNPRGVGYSWYKSWGWKKWEDVNESALGALIFFSEQSPEDTDSDPWLALELVGTCLSSQPIS